MSEAGTIKKDVPAIMQITGLDGRPLLAIHPDGTVEGAVEDAGEAARRFVESLRLNLAAAQVVPQPDREALRGALLNVLCNVMNFPENVQARLLGRDMNPLNDKVTDAVIAHLSAQTVEGEVEWGVRWIGTAGSPITDIGADEADVLELARDQKSLAAAVKRTVGPWIEVRS